MRPYPIRENRGEKTGVGTRPLWAAIAIVALVYVALYVSAMYARVELPETEVVFGAVDAPIVTRGVIVRDEKLYKSYASGVAVYNVSEEERVKKGTVACSVEDETIVADIESRLRDVNESILSRQNETGAWFSEDVKRVEDKVKKTIDQAAFTMSAVNIAAVYDLADKVSESLNYRNNMMFDDREGNLRGILSHQSSLSGQLTNARNVVAVTDSGIFSTRSDGLEGEFSLSRLGSITKEETLIEADMVNLAVSRDVKDGSPLFRVVNSNEWYVAAYMPEKLVADWRKNMFVTLQVERGGLFSPFEFRVHTVEKTARGDGDMYVVLKATKYMTEFINERVINIKAPQGITEGLKIPKAAVSDKTYVKVPAECVFTSGGGDERELVRKKTGSKDENIYITVKKRDDDFVYVLLDYNKLHLGDSLAVKGDLKRYETLSQIENVRGVFVTNSGSAVFCEIRESGSFVDNDEYVLLDPSANSGLKTHDKIASDIRYINDEMLVY